MTEFKTVAAATRAVMRAFARRGGRVSRADYLSLILGQVQEAIQHADRNEDEKYRHEISDVISIAYQALMAEHVNPDRATIQRIEDKVLPKMRDGTITAKYRLRESKP